MRVTEMSNRTYINFLRDRKMILDGIYEALVLVCGPLKYNKEAFRMHLTTEVMNWLLDKDGFAICTHPNFATKETHRIQDVLDNKKYEVNIFNDNNFMIANFQNSEVRICVKHLKQDAVFNEEKGEFEDIIEERYDTHVILGPVHYSLINIPDIPLYDEDFEVKNIKRLSKR